MFQILEFTEAKLATLTPRSERHGDDEKPAVSLALTIEGPNTMLDCIDPKIRHSLYMPKPDAEPELPGVEPSTPILRCNSFETHKLATAHEGWTLAIDDGVDGTDPMLFGGCKVDKFTIDAKQGGSIELKFRVGTSDLDAERSGFLGMHVGQPVWITLKVPEKKPDAIDGTQSAFERDHPPGEGDATDLFSQTSAEGGAGPGDEDDSEGGETDAGSAETEGANGETEGAESGTAAADAAMDAPWPFPKNAATDKPPQSVVVETSRPGTRTARGRDRTKAALAAGQAEHSAATQTIGEASDEAQAFIAAESKKHEAADAGAAS